MLYNECNDDKDTGVDFVYRFTYIHPSDGDAAGIEIIDALSIIGGHTGDKCFVKGLSSRTSQSSALY